MHYYLDDDVLTEIFLRLPAISLLRLKCVSRRWHSLISDPKFAKARLTMSLQRSPHPPEKVLLNDWSQPCSIDIIQSQDGSVEDIVPTQLDYLESICKKVSIYDVVGQCRGLLYLRSYNYEQSVLYNPTTRNFRKLPKRPRLCDSGPRDFCGLGYDARNDDYKLVHGLSHGSGDGGGWTYYIFSLKSDSSWRSIENPNGDVILERRGKYSNGFLYWRVIVGMVDKIVSFDVAAEKFCEELLPMPRFSAGGGYTRLNVTGGGWLVANREWKWQSNAFEVWVMEDCRRGSNSTWTWTKLCTIGNEQLSKCIQSTPCISTATLIIGGKVFVLCLPWLTRSICIYDAQHDSFKTFSLPHYQNICKDVITHVESLESFE